MFDDEILYEVLTLPEVAFMWQRHQDTVRKAIFTLHGGLVARKSPDSQQGQWLITYRSCVARWGKPERLPLDHLVIGRHA